MKKKRIAKRSLSASLAVLLLVGLLAGCSNSNDTQDATDTTDTQAAGTTEDGTASSVPSDLNYPVEPEELGSGDVKWSESETADGWIMVTNEGGETLGYSKDSGIELIQVDGYAFKDLNRDGKLNLYEDWRQDTNARATDLASMMTGEEIVPMMLHGTWNSFASTPDESDTSYIKNGGRASLTRSAASDGNTAMAATWTNALQALAESEGGYGIPVSISIDPAGMSSVINQLALGSTMDTDLAYKNGIQDAEEFRAVGITQLLGPQVDVIGSPVYGRSSGSLSEDPALTRDLAAAYIDGLQSTYDENGNDLGWGNESVLSITKHFVGAGASEGGRDDHSATGKYTVFPNDSFGTHLLPFFDGAFNLSGATKSAGGVMPNYGISYSEDGSLGELVGGGYSKFKNDLLRDNGFDGIVVTDWEITTDGQRDWGVEELTVPERFCALFKNGVNQIGGTRAIDEALEGYKLLVADMGEEDALALIRDSARRILTAQMNVGIFENPYITKEYAVANAYTEETKAYGIETQLQSVIMLKNADDTIHAYDASAEKPTVYIQYKYVTTTNVFFVEGVPNVSHTYSFEPGIDPELASQYYNVVMDSIGEPSGTDDEGNAIYLEEDLIRASAEELAACDYAIVRMDAPYEGSSYDAETDTWSPASIQYEPYTADSAAVSRESIAGDMVMGEVNTVYGNTTQEVQENRSHYGNTSAVSSSYGDYETLKYVENTVPDDCKIIVLMMAKGSMVWSEVEPLADAILLFYDFSKFDEGFKDVALMDLIVGNAEPSGLLPMQQPASMEAVEEQTGDDVPRDVECYVDATGNTYDFTFGMNWSGVIQDARTEKYNVPALTTPETIQY